MTLDTQLDRFVSSLTVDDEQKQSETFERPVDHAPKEHATSSDAAVAVATPTNPFEGFGSFS